MLNIFATGHEWNRELNWAAIARGFPARTTSMAAGLVPGKIFYVPNQFPGQRCIADKQYALKQMPDDPAYQWITDRTQIDCYENKIRQAALFGGWMPETHVFKWYTDALEHLDCMYHSQFPIISKSAVGSASLNVRLLKNKSEAKAELDRIFRGGLPIRQGPGPDALQKDYVIWQAFVPHEFTYRVTIVGSKFHVYKRFNFDDRPMACPSKVKPTEPVEISPEIDRLWEWAQDLCRETLHTKWCALDILPYAQTFRLLETSPAWARGNDAAGNAPFFGTKRSLNQQFELLIDELERAPW